MTEPTGDSRYLPARAPVEPLVRDFNLATLRALRHEVERYGTGHGLTEVALYRFVVAVNELTTNAVRHGGGAGRLELWRVGDLLHCRVTDEGPGIPADEHPDGTPPSPDALNGRGLWLARLNTNSFVIDSRNTGTSIAVTARVA